MKKYNEDGDFLLSCITYHSRERDLHRIAETGGIGYTTLLSRVKEDFGEIRLSTFRALIDRYGLTDEEIIKLARGMRHGKHRS